MKSETPSCFECENHEKIGRNKTDCYCWCPSNWLGKKELIDGIRSGECLSFSELTDGRSIYNG